jgi:DegV family protein with EDD domain
MNQFAILTDSGADLPQAMVEELDVAVVPLRYTIQGQERLDWPDHREMDPHVFYDLLRQGERATTAALNVHDYLEHLTPLLQAGQDVLVLVFSSGLSTTYQSCVLAAEELREQYPDRKLLVVDTLCASMGQGLLVWHAAQLRAQGKTIEEVRDWVEENKLHLCHWFTVDDLNHLKRGGRVSAATALVGTMLSIKPVLHVDDEGHLISMGKARGRAASMKALVDKMAQTAIEPEKQTIFISHSDCEEDARKLAELVRERFGVEAVIGEIGPVIGAHSGPGTLALYFLGKER